MPQAFGPQPKDGTMLEATWASLSWRAGDFAISHDVYIGEDFDDVSAGAEGTFVGNQAAMTLIVGFVGFPIPSNVVFWGKAFPLEKNVRDLFLPPFLERGCPAPLLLPPFPPLPFKIEPPLLVKKSGLAPAPCAEGSFGV